MLCPGEHAQEANEDHLKSVLRGLQREIRYRRLFADNELQFWNQVHHQLAICTNSLPDRIPAMVDFLLTFTQHLAHKALEGMRQGSIGDIWLLSVKFPRNEIAALWHNHLVQLIYDRGFADAGITGYKHELRSPVSDDSIEDIDKDFAASVASVKLLRDHESIRHVVYAQREWIDPPEAIPGRKASPKVCLYPCGGLIALLCGFAEELHDDGRNPLRDPLESFIGRHWLPGDVAMDPLHGIGRRKWKRPCQHFVERYAERVKIAPCIDRPIHTTGLFGRHVGQCSGYLLGQCRDLRPRKVRHEADADEPSLPGCRVH